MTIANFPVKSRRLSVEQALEEAKKLGFAQVLIVGTTASGQSGIVCSTMSNERGLWLAESARNWAMRDEKGDE